MFSRFLYSFLAKSPEGVLHRFFFFKEGWYTALKSKKESSKHGSEMKIVLMLCVYETLVWVQNYTEQINLIHNLDFIATTTIKNQHSWLYV